MGAAVVVLVLCVMACGAYMLLLQLQLRSMNRQLEKRLSEQTRQPVRLELFNRELSRLAVSINRCLQAEEALRLESLREEKRFKEMISHISHDLRTPLTAIRGYQELMEKEPLTDKQQSRLRTAQKHAGELGRLVERFFEYSYLVDAGARLNVAAMELTELITECLAESVAAFEEKGLAVRLEAPASVYALADKEITIRMLQNLIHNCVIHSAGDVEVRVYQDAEGQAVIAFRNPVAAGVNLSPERVFERFYTAEPARSRSTGLGLSIVRLLAEQMGGRAGADFASGMLEIWVKLPAP